MGPEEETMVQYRHLIPASVDRASASAWLNKHLDNVPNK